MRRGDACARILTCLAAQSQQESAVGGRTVPPRLSLIIVRLVHLTLVIAPNFYSASNTTKPTAPAVCQLGSGRCHDCTAASPRRQSQSSLSASAKASSQQAQKGPVECTTVTVWLLSANMQRPLRHVSATYLSLAAGHEHKAAQRKPCNTDKPVYGKDLFHPTPNAGEFHDQSRSPTYSCPYSATGAQTPSTLAQYEETGAGTRSCQTVLQ